VTVALDRDAAAAVLGTDPDRLVVVRSRGTHREFELVTLLRRAGRRFRRLTVAAGSALDGATLGEAAVRDTYAVAVLAVRHEGRWVVAPRGSQAVAAGDEVYAVGAGDALTAFEGAVT
jgi:Trk K+ transport system NAD-binding subunit